MDHNFTDIGCGSLRSTSWVGLGDVMELNRLSVKFVQPSAVVIVRITVWALILSVVFYYWWIWGRPWSRRFNKLQGPGSLPFLGAAWLILNPDHVHKNIGKYAAKFNKCGRFWLGHIPYFITTDVEIIEKILSNPIHAEKAEAYSNSHFLVGQGLVAARVEKWKRDRKIMLPCLKSSMFPAYLDNFNKNSNILLKVLENLTNGLNALASFDMREYFARCMMDIVFETLLGTKAGVQSPGSDFYEAFTACFHLVETKMFLPWIKLQPFWHLLGYAKAEKENMAKLRNTINEDMIRNKMKEVNFFGDVAGTGKQLAHYLYQKNNDVADIFHQFLTVLAGGYDTTSTVLNHTVYLLAVHLDVQQKLRDELDAVFDGDADRDATTSDLEQLHYLDLVLKESMRFLSPTPILGRTLGEDLDLGGNRGIVPAGANILIPAIHVQHDPDIWTDRPEYFIPDRFLSQSSRNPYGYLVFSFGPRGCFAPKFATMSMKVILAKVFRNYTVTTRKPLDSCVFHYGVVLHIKGGLPVTLHPRASNQNQMQLEEII